MKISANYVSELWDNLIQLEYKILCQFCPDLCQKTFGFAMKEDDKLTEESDLLMWYRCLFLRIGIWPKDNTGVLRFTLSLIWILIHMATEWADVISRSGDLEGIVMTLAESSNFILTLTKLIMYRKNCKLGQIIDVMKEDWENNKLKTCKERERYAVYESLAKSFSKILQLLISTTGVAYCLRALGEYFFTRTQNEKVCYALPYRTRQFYEITNVYTYALTYAFQAGALYIDCICYIASDGLMLMITMHMCGQLSALTESIENWKYDKKDNHRLKIGNILDQYHRIVWMAEQMNNEFGMVFFLEVSDIFLLICLNGFNVVGNSDFRQSTNLVGFIVYEATLLLILYGYCFGGECLTGESKRLRNAFYKCDWFEMPTSRSKDMIVCIAGSEKPICLKAGKICIFSLELFTQAVKTSVGYISVLGTLV